jgi:hypothetical protein
MPAQRVEPYIWGFIGTALAGVLMLVSAMVGFQMSAERPLLGGFMLGWMAGHAWNWAGRKR